MREALRAQRLEQFATQYVEEMFHQSTLSTDCVALNKAFEAQF
ncbi:hypothetical protein ACKI1H_18305 [Pseudomonas sp. YH-1]